MKLEKIIKSIQEVANSRYEIISNEIDSWYENSISNKIKILQIKRKGSFCETVKTLLFADISDIESSEQQKKELKEIMLSVAMIKESLRENENTDLYLFLALPERVSQEECIRIEATEQLCRKYVLMPDEGIFDFFERTFLASMLIEKVSINGKEPIDVALTKTRIKYDWMSNKIQKEWRETFLEYSGMELVEKLVGRI